MLPLSSHRRALLAQIDDELARRGPKTGASFDPLAFCHPGQREAVADRSVTQAWVTTRRAGKSKGAVFKLLGCALATPDVHAVYVSTSIKRAKKTLWDGILKANRKHNLGGIPNHTDRELRLPNGSKVVVTGCESRQMADEAIRGVYERTAILFVDEGQDWKPDLLDYFYASVVVPSLADIGGIFILAGTPGTPRGFFYDFHKTAGVALHSWSLFGNPHVKNAREMMLEAMRVRGCDELDPSIQREFFAKFATDTQRQIFPYDEKKNGITRAELKQLGGKWSYYVGGDVGTVDATAAVVWGWTPASPNLYVVETEKLASVGSSAQTELIRQVSQRYQNGLIGVDVDPGGGGKGLIVDLMQEHLLPMSSADKTKKAAACVLLRDGLRSGRVKIVTEEKAFVDELTSVEWDPDHIGDVVRGHCPDRVDAALYGYRKATKLHHFTPAPEPSKNPDLDRLLAAEAEAKAAMADLGVVF